MKFIILSFLMYITSAHSEEISETRNCGEVDDHKIAFMGSSVCYGLRASEAPNNWDYYASYTDLRKGWVYNVATMLDTRFNEGSGEDWYVSNVSISGDNTSKVLNRWENDLLSECSKYVVYCLSQANEGYNAESFKNGMNQIISKTHEQGMIPIIATNYSNGGMNDGMYTKTKDMNAWINSLDVPSINVLGALDNTLGQWGSWYQYDDGHPNDRGYLEMSTAVVPSLFEALHAQKPIPMTQSTTHVTMVPNTIIEFSPEALTHSFATTIDMRTTASGTLLEIINGADSYPLIINAQGNVEFAQSGIVGHTSVTDGAWHTLTITHYHTIGRTYLYVDGDEQGILNDTYLSPTRVTIGHSNAPETMDVRNWYFHRAGLNTNQIADMHSGILIQSSLELYAPLNGEGLITETALVNYAQSLNTVTSNNYYTFSNESSEEISSSEEVSSMYEVMSSALSSEPSSSSEDQTSSSSEESPSSVYDSSSLESESSQDYISPLGAVTTRRNLNLTVMESSITITIEEPTQLNSLTVMSVHGQRISELKQRNGSAYLNTSALKPGIYFVIAQNNAFKEIHSFTVF
ncbi:MAG: SGNH/GDSL hydrolase family protein [Fibrobacterales bacterium]